MDLPTNNTPPSRPSIYLLGDNKPRAVVIIIALLAIAIFAYTQIVPKATRSVTVVGTGEKKVQAQKATVTFILLLSGTDKNQLLDIGEARMRDIATDLGTFQTSSYTQTAYQLVPQYNRTGGVADTSSIRGYQYASGGQITIENITQLTSLLAILNQREATVAQLRYLPAEEKVADKEARELAILDAKEKATQLAKASGARLGKVLTITEQGSNGTTGSSATSIQDGSSTQTPLSDITIQSQVTVSFEVW